MTNRDQIFHKTTLIGLVLFVLSGLALSWFLLVTIQSDGDSMENDARSASPKSLGTKALYDLLHNLDFPVAQLTNDNKESGSNVRFAVVVAPSSQHFLKSTLARYRNADGLLIVLPKRVGIVLTDDVLEMRSDDIGLDEAQEIMTAIKPGVRVVRITTPGWSTAIPAGTDREDLESLNIEPSLSLPQVVEGRWIEPIVVVNESASQRRLILVGEIKSTSPRTWLLTDPDIVSNHGLDDGDNAVLAVKIIETLRSMSGATDGPVVFDDAIHGQTSVQSFWSIMTRFPYVVITITFLLFGGVLGWVGLTRFGGVVENATAIHAGRSQLMFNATKLLLDASNDAFLLNRYATNSTRQVATRLNLPQREIQGGNYQSFENLERSRRSQHKVSELMETTLQMLANEQSKQKELIKVAKEVDQWKKEILGESRRT